MKTKDNLCGFFAILAFCLLIGTTVFGQTETLDQPELVPTINLSGPRLGLTFINSGDLASELRSRWDVAPVITQFGWQFETQVFSLPSGHAGLVEWILLAGGLEQNVFLPSITMMFGLRGPAGVEFGFGPNVSLAGASFAFAVGVTARSGPVNFPINLAFVPSSRGNRISLLFGFNTRRK